MEPIASPFIIIPQNNADPYESGSTPIKISLNKGKNSPCYEFELIKENDRKKNVITCLKLHKKIKMSLGEKIDQKLNGRKWVALQVKDGKSEGFLKINVDDFCKKLGITKKQLERDLKGKNDATKLLDQIYEREFGLEGSNIGTFKAEKKETLRRISKGPLARLAVRSGVVKGTEDQHLRAIKIIDDIADYMKSAVSQKTSKELYKDIQHQYELVQLMDENGSWDSNIDEALSDQLLPAEEDALQKCLDFIDSVVANVKKNPYLLAAIDNIDEEQLEKFRQKALENGVEMVQYLIPYSIALNGLTDAFIRDVDLFEKIDRKWTQAKGRFVGKHLSFFGMIKYYTLGHLSAVKKNIKTQKISKDAYRKYLNLNITEAVMADLYLGNHDNAEAGLKLVKHPVGGKHNPLTESGPASINTKKRGYSVAEIHPDFPKQWADLYAVWNFAFCSNANNFPILAAKLLIPSVNDYASHPESYMFCRIIALYLYFQFSVFRTKSKETPSFLEGWSFPGITRALGEANLASAEKYDQTAQARKIIHKRINRKVYEEEENRLL